MYCYLLILWWTGDKENNIDDNEANGDFQIAMEVWIEPQYGYAQTGNHKKAAYMQSLEYNELPEAVSEKNNFTCLHFNIN